MGHMTSGQYRDMVLKNEEDERVRKQLINTLGVYSEDAERVRSFNESSYNREATRRAYNKFVSNIKPLLLSECIMHLFKSSTKNLDSNKINVGMRLANQFVQENSCDTLLRRFSTKSEYLSEISLLIEQTEKSIIEGIDKDNPESFCLDPSSFTMNDFYSKLDLSTPDDVVDAIRTRTSDAVQEFIDNQTMDKMNIQSALQDVKNRIDGVTNESTIAGLQQECRKRINNIKLARPRNVFECLVFGMSNNSYKNEVLKNKFVNESTSKLDVESIIEECEIIYTFLETVVSSKMVDCDREFVSNIINSVK